jgi:hypothetical protein
MSNIPIFILFVFTVLNITSLGCKNTQTDAPVGPAKDSTSALPLEIPAFDFVLYDGLAKDAAEPIRSKLAENSPRILSDLQAAQADTYTVYLWGTNESYLDAQQQRIGTRYPGSTGYVMGPSAMGLLNVAGVAGNAVHEYAHSISLRINGSFGNNPRWCWEAVALYESGGFIDPRNINYLANGNYPSLNDLNSDFNTGNQKIYQVGYLLVEFIKARWGMNAVIDLIKQNGNIQRVFGKTNAEFESEWKQYIEAKYFSR